MKIKSFRSTILICILCFVILGLTKISNGDKQKMQGIVTFMMLYDDEDSTAVFASSKVNTWVGWIRVISNTLADSSKLTITTIDPPVGTRSLLFHVVDGPGPQMVFGMVNDHVDASNTGRMTMWVKANPGTPTIWFWVEDDSETGDAKQSAFIAIRGSEVFHNDTLIINEPWNGKWQFVSLPWSLILSNDTTFVKNAIPGSWTRPISSCKINILKRVRLDTYAPPPGSSSRPPSDQGYTADYHFDQVRFIPLSLNTTVEKDKKSNVPVLYKLNQSFPNPFNPTATISYDLPTSSNVTLVIYNMAGQKVKTLVSNEIQNAGSYSVRWDGRNERGQAVSSGIYLYRIEASHFTATKKMILLK